MTTTEITEDASRASSCTSQSRCSVLDTLSPSDRYCIDAAAHAWVNGGGDADGLAWMWHTLQERVRELS
jgi:hypothetical protein